MAEAFGEVMTAIVAFVIIQGVADVEVHKWNQFCAGRNQI